MLTCAFLQIIRRADIQRPISLTGHNVCIIAHRNFEPARASLPTLLPQLVPAQVYPREGGGGEGDRNSSRIVFTCLAGKVFHLPVGWAFTRPWRISPSFFL